MLRSPGRRQCERRSYRDVSRETFDDRGWCSSWAPLQRISSSASGGDHPGAAGPCQHGLCREVWKEWIAFATGDLFCSAAFAPVCGHPAPIGGPSSSSFESGAMPSAGAARGPSLGWLSLSGRASRRLAVRCVLERRGRCFTAPSHLWRSTRVRFGSAGWRSGAALLPEVLSATHARHGRRSHVGAQPFLHIASRSRDTPLPKATLLITSRSRDTPLRKPLPRPTSCIEKRESPPLEVVAMEWVSRPGDAVRARLITQSRRLCCVRRSAVAHLVASHGRCGGMFHVKHVIRDVPQDEPKGSGTSSPDDLNRDFTAVRSHSRI